MSVKYYVSPTKLMSMSIVLFCIFMSSCATKPHVYINPNTNFGFIKRVAVLPLENLTTDRFADKKVRDVLVTTLLSTEVIDVPELGEVLKVLESQGIVSQQEITSETARAIGQMLSVQGLILGTVEEYAVNRTAAGSFPEIAVTFRMLDTKTGNIIWSVSHTEKGGRVIPTIFGCGESSLSEAASKAVKKIVETLVYE